MTKTGRTSDVVKEEVKKFLGICIIMGNLKFPRLRMYWQTKYIVQIISETMTQSRFLFIHANLAATCGEEPTHNTNKYWKVHPVVEIVRNGYRALEPEKFNSVDEQMIPFHGRCPACQYIKNKPNPVGIKSFVRCGKSGKAYDFELYQGAGTGISAEHTYLGLGGSIVMRLVENIPRNENFEVFFDNYFTSIALLLELKALGMYSLGVVKSNRMAGVVLKPKTAMQKEGRGSMDSRVTKSREVVVVRWHDNNSVNVASTFVGIGKIDAVKRWSAKEKTFIEVNRPEAIKEYNDYMGGVDKMDFLISLYPMIFRTKRWPTRIILHLVSMSQRVARIQRAGNSSG